MFSTCNRDNQYRRLGTDFKTNIFVGFNEDGHMSLVITERGTIVATKSSKQISVSLRMREDGKLALAFDLLDNSYKPLFITFCKDIIMVTEKSGPEMAISSALERWKYWKEMFGKKPAAILSKSEIKGLIGELILLRDYFIPKYGSYQALCGWLGPLLGHKDFEIADTWYEVKSVNENAIQIRINSLEQLQADSPGHLAVVLLEDTSTVNANKINLNSIVLSIVEQLEDLDSLELFRARMESKGYRWNPEYDNYNFSYKGHHFYSIEEGFPALTRTDVSEAIGNVEYTVILTSISQFMED